MANERIPNDPYDRLSSLSDPDAGRPQRFDGELEAAARLIEADEYLRLDLLAFAKWIGMRSFGRHGPAPEHDAVDLRAAVLEGEIAVTRGRAAEIGEFAPYPEQREAPLERVAHAAQQLRDGNYGASEVIGHVRWRSEAEPSCRSSFPQCPLGNPAPAPL